jgi:hypothetical protein
MAFRISLSAARARLIQQILIEKRPDGQNGVGEIRENSRA